MREPAANPRLHPQLRRADKEDYKGRNVVERNFNIFKQWRALATRYDKLALTYRGGAVLRAIIIWLTALGDTP
ncbi:transposase (plasmid) [Glutamicibacter sp. PAEs-4]|uniref:transposase n=1 Tax=Glutamicibacter sp. PAEs-4 TaxID=3444114 RepID=UPI00167F48D9|nr:transposase [Glutamicibacter nicotianae]